MCSLSTIKKKHNVNPFCALHQRAYLLESKWIKKNSKANAWCSQCNATRSRLKKSEAVVMATAAATVYILLFISLNQIFGAHFSPWVCFTCIEQFALFTSGGGGGSDGVILLHKQIQYHNGFYHT